MTNDAVNESMMGEKLNSSKDFKRKVYYSECCESDLQGVSRDILNGTIFATSTVSATSQHYLPMTARKDIQPNSL